MRITGSMQRTYKKLQWDRRINGEQLNTNPPAFNADEWQEKWKGNYERHVARCAHACECVCRREWDLASVLFGFHWGVNISSHLTPARHWSLHHTHRHTQTYTHLHLLDLPHFNYPTRLASSEKRGLFNGRFKGEADGQT